MVAPSGRTTPAGGSRRDSFQAPPAANTTSVKVVLRIRPTAGSDASNVPQRFQRTCIHAVNPTTLQVDQTVAAHAGATAASAAVFAKATGKTTFTFDRVIGPEEGQPAVYECAESLVEAFMEGHNVTILAYGQTSSGKSYTMGTDRTSEADDNMGEERVGITPRAVASIFEKMKEVTRETKGGTTFAAKLSYVEIYNEDLIDLLAGDLDVRPTVQIREDKSGSIIWSGLREVKVTSAADVMNNLTQGSSLRQTNATDMNAQSSRSHAIFSLTLTQRKYTGTGPLPAPQASRIHRASILPRVSSPTPGSRSATPTNERPGSRISMRPSSAMGAKGASSAADEGKEGGADTWSTITSKFHFVDLAGSERLKRTSAQGERVKEGISINSGLHALGNVISALGDPARARQTTHIPYRDSKLTRLLQDSLGGNAQTMMVACVSPSEFNLNETLSTVKYANRARNIKNRAEINEVEVGWDDVDYLQRTILRLRGELGALKGGEGVASMGTISEEGRTAAGSSRELQNKYSDLTQRYAQLTADLAKAQLGASASSSTSLSREDFAKAVEPIVEEYEKSLSALESQLSLTKAALGHSEEEMRELEARIEEEARENEASGILVAELKSRVAKLAEREATTEAYVRDLESKLKDYGDQDESHGSAVSDLRKEIARSREQAATTEQYIKDVEGRLAKSDDFTATLRRQTEVLERDVERREEAYRDLEGRLSLLDTSGEHKLLVAEIDERDKRLLDLERSLNELKIKTATAEQEAQRLEKIAHLEKEAKEELQSRVRTLERASMTLASAGLSTKARSAGFPPSSDPSARDELDSPSLPSPAQASAGPDVVGSLELRIEQLQTTYDQTVAELDSANAKYQESLKEIEDLNSQVEEAKLVHSEDGDLVPSPSSPNFAQASFVAIASDDSESERPLTTTPTVSSLTTLTSASRSPRSRRSMPLAPQHRLSFLGRGQGAPQSHLRSASLSQELSVAQGLQSSSPPSPQAVPPSNHRESRDWSSGATDRTYEQMKGEVMKLQQALNEREEEIAALETNLFQLRGPPPSHSGDTSDSSISPPRIVTNGMITPPRKRSQDDLNLSPKTIAAFSALKAELSSATVAAAGSPLPFDEENSARLDDLMRSMAKKESGHREAIDLLEDQLSTLRRQHDDLRVLSRDQVVNMSSEIDLLRTQLEGRPEASHYDARLQAMQENLESKRAEVDLVRQQAATDLSATTAKLAEEHRRALDAIKAEHASLFLQLKEQHADTLRRALDERDEVLKQKEVEYAAALRSQAAEHADVLKLQSTDHVAALQAKVDELVAAQKRRTDEQDEASRRFEIERSALVDSGEKNFATSLEKLNVEHAAVLQRRQVEFETSSEKLKKDHADALATRDTTHSFALGQLREKHDLASAEMIASHSSAVSRLHDDHEGLTDQLAQQHSGAISALRAEHASALSAAAEEFEARSKAVADAHSAELAAAGERFAGEADSKVAALSSEHSTALLDLSSTHDRALQSLAESHASRLFDLATEREEAVKGLEGSHEGALAALAAQHAIVLAAMTERHGSDSDASGKALEDEHANAFASLLEQHAGAVTSLASEHASNLEALKADHAQALPDQQASHASIVDALTTQHGQQLQSVEAERDAARSSHEELLSTHLALVAEHDGLVDALTSTTAEHDDVLQHLAELSAQHDDLGIQATSLQTSLTEAVARCEAAENDPQHEATAAELQEALDALSTLEKALFESQEERERLLDQVHELREVDGSEKSKYDSIFKELEHYRGSVLKLDAELARTQTERDSLSTQLARLSVGQHSLPNGSPDPNGSIYDSATSRSMSPDRAMSPNGEGGQTLNRHDSRLGFKPPPPTPPPSMPPPPLPTSLPGPPGGTSSARGVVRTSSSSSMSTSIANSRNSSSMDTIGTSVRSPGSNSTDSALIDARVAKKFEEQEAQIARLTKQLTHCESDLQANIDLVNTLESALNDSERNLRKARTQMNDLAKERDAFLGQNDALRMQIQEAHSEVETVRHSVIQVETRLQEERQGKERAKAELERRLEDVNRRKSKFACF